MSTTDVEDTSVNEETQDDVELEDIEVSLDDMNPEEPDELSADTTEGEESEADTTTEETEEESADATVEEDKEPEVAEPKQVDTSAQERQEAARLAFQEREAKRQDFKLKAQSDYIAEAEDDKDLALRQLQIDAYNNKVEATANKLQNSIDKAVASIDLFTSGSNEAKEELANSLDDFERMYVVRDQNGDPIDVKADMYQFLQKKADSIRKLTGVGARQQEQDKSKTKSRTLSAPNAKPKAPKVDPDLLAFDEEAFK